ncbi:MAG: carbon storage regulator CsrA [Actinobacteria bacterium]|nr:carbon storage regulator CsrA [Actinomycetota bacterium]
MLVLTRRPGESVMVGDDVVVTVLEVRGDVIRLGIAAPRSVTVHREEVYREVQRANREAASSADRAAEMLGSLLRPGGAVVDPTIVDPTIVDPTIVDPAGAPLAQPGSAQAPP